MHSSHPAFFMALSFFFGVANYFLSYLFLIPFAAYLLSYRHHFLFICVFTVLGFGYSALVAPSFLPSEGKWEGAAHVTLDEIKPFTTPFFHGLELKGTLHAFYPKGSSFPIGNHHPLSIRLSTHLEKRPSANQSYWIYGTLLMPPSGHLVLKPSSLYDWHPLPGRKNGAEWRFYAKEKVREWIEDNIPDIASAHFLTGLATGQFDDPYLYKELGRVGVQHILAISGLHFAIFAALLNLFFRLFFSMQKAAILVLLALTAYVIFLGFSPSIYRAYIGAGLFFGGLLIHKNPQALNSLGVSLFLLLLIDPSLVKHLGFQFSFLSTLALLVFAPSIDTLLMSLFSKHPLKETLKMNRWNQHGYVVLSLFRESFALNLAITIVTLPLIFYTFHQFPLSSLFYNCFFPFLSGLSLMLLLLSALCFPVAAPLHWINAKLTSFTLQLIFNLPSALDVWIRWAPSPTWLTLYWSVILLLGLTKIRTIDYTFSSWRS